LVLALVIAGARCAGSGSGGAGTGGTGAGGPAGAAAGPGGSGAGTGAAGHNGTAGSGNITGAAGQNGTAGSGNITGVAGQNGAAGTTGSGIAGQPGGSAGTAGSGSTPSICSGTFSSPATIPAGSTATRIAGAPPSDTFNNLGNNFSNIEGPVWIGNALYVSELLGSPNPPPARLLKIDESDTVTPFYPAAGATGDSGSNGNAVDGMGRLVSANHGVGGIVAFNVATKTEVTPPIIDSFGGTRFNSPNDLTIRSDGTIYFTDPTLQAASPPPQATTGVYMVPPGPSPTATELITNLSNPNGITLSLDEHTLYVSHGGGVYSYAVSANGMIGATATHVDPPDLDNNASDGMAIDCAGDLYIVRINTHDIVVVGFGGNPGSAGTKLTTITGIPGGGQITNVAFGGANHQTLYITVMGTGTQRGVFKLPMPLPGMPY
jgi:gluconolactonase